MACKPSPELLAISKNIESICRGIVSSSSVTSFALKLEEKGLIEKGAKDVLRSPIPEYNQCSKLLESVQEQVTQDRNKFEPFVKIFRSEAALETYADQMVAVYEEEKRKYQAIPPKAPLTVETSKQYAAMMANLVYILDKSPNSLNRMVTYFTHFAVCIEDQNYIAISREEFKTVQSFFNCLAEYLKPPECSLLEQLVHVSNCKDAINILNEYLDASQNTSLETTPAEKSSEDSESPVTTSEPLSGSSHVTTVVATEEMDWGGLRNLQALICGLYDIPKYFLKFERANPGSLVLRWKTSKKVVMKMQSVQLDITALKRLKRENVISIKLGETHLSIKDLIQQKKKVFRSSIISRKRFTRNTSDENEDSVCKWASSKNLVARSEKAREIAMRRAATYPSLFHRSNTLDALPLPRGESATTAGSPTPTNSPTTTADYIILYAAAAAEPRRRKQLPRVILRLRDEKTGRSTRQRQKYRQSRAHMFLDDMSSNNADFMPLSRPRSTAVLDKKDDSHRPVNRRRRPSGRGISFTRSLEYGMDTVGLDEEPPDLTRWGSQKSIPSLSSSEDDLDRKRGPGVNEEEEEEEDYPINTESDAESTGDELKREKVVSNQLEQCFGNIELVSSLTCKCGSKEVCFHRNYWIGEVMEDQTLKIFQDEKKEREINMSPSDSSLSEIQMEERVCKMTPRSMVFSNPS